MFRIGMVVKQGVEYTGKEGSERSVVAAESELYSNGLSEQPQGGRHSWKRLPSSGKVSQAIAKGNLEHLEIVMHMNQDGSSKERHGTIEGLNLTNYELSMATETQFHDFRIFVGTWNVGGKAPNNGLHLEDFLQVEGASDIYVLGFQEIVPLNAGNVLVIEDNEPAAKWLALICQALNKPQDENSANDSSDSSHGSKSQSNKDSKSKFFNKPNLKVLARNCKVNGSLVKACNCPFESVVVPRRQLDEPLNKLDYLVTTKLREDSNIEGFLATAGIPTTTNQLNYRLVASKQMVGIFLSVWAKNDLVKHIGHLRISCVGRGIMGCLGNKGCISISMTIFQTSFCFVCSHLASGEKEGDELRRNADVAEILKSSQFPKICKNPTSPIPEKILDHEVSLGYEETRALLEDNDWDTLLVRDQLNVEREAGRVFSGFKEGRILFAPTYKYSHNSDSYAGETTKSKKKRRTPAWCDRILWHGNGIEQLSYIRGESRFSDHRPVCAVFQVEVEMRAKTSKYRKGFSFVPSRVEYDDSIPKRHSFYD
ncbi:hypothetical protein RJ641_011747 [Dillenia turbinata]|uniref:Inositol polyphosphate-related phosphatase domain-containing protein n=1 Tax=Dillenia turbinata TaxID=194707 RepID=A0AAN8V908_9MAGN